MSNISSPTLSAAMISLPHSQSLSPLPTTYYKTETTFPLPSRKPPLTDYVPDFWKKDSRIFQQDNGIFGDSSTPWW